MKATKSPVVALAIADAHFWHKPPVARSAESNWLDAQDRNIQQLKALQREHRPPPDKFAQHDVPILVAGDLFDRPFPNPEMINFLLGALPNEMYGVPGNHDLPNHLMSEFRRSGFCTLVKAGKIKLLNARRPAIPFGFPFLRLWGFPCGEEPRTIPERNVNTLLLDIAVVHAYVWRKDASYVGAEKQDFVAKWRKRLKGFDVAIFGDNHIPFNSVVEGKLPAIANCGAFIRRKQDERNYKPSVVLIRQDGSLERVLLDGSKDKWLDAAEMAKQIGVDGEMEDFVNELNHLGDQALNFKDAVKVAIKSMKPNPGVVKLILEAMEETLS